MFIEQSRSSIGKCTVQYSQANHCNFSVLQEPFASMCKRKILQRRVLHLKDQHYNRRSVLILHPLKLGTFYKTKFPRQDFFLSLKGLHNEHQPFFPGLNFPPFWTYISEEKQRCKSLWMPPSDTQLFQCLHRCEKLSPVFRISSHSFNEKFIYFNIWWEIWH